MKRYLLLTLLASCSLQATILNFGYGESNEAVTGNGQVANGANARKWSINGIEVTVQAFALVGNPTTGTFSAANTTQFGVAQSAANNLGIGICNSVEQSNCTFNEWQADDNGPSDFFFITFSQGVNISNLKIQQTSASLDSDAAYWASNTLFSAPQAGSALTLDPGTVLSAGQSRTLLTGAGITGGIRTFLFGAYNSDQAADYFKFVSMDITASNTPEPGSMALLGSGLVALSLASRRRK